MSNTPLTDMLDAARERRTRLGLVRQLSARGAGGEPGRDAAGLLDLAGNDYLGLLTDPDVIDAAVAAVRAYGAGAGASRLVTGHLELHEELEGALAAHMGAETALVFSTGYHANLAAVTALTGADCLVVSDAHVHASLVDGARLAKAPVAIARHGDVAPVEELLAARSEARAVILAESVYSVLGDAAPLRDLLAVARRYGATVLLDEAHGLGVVGARGEGLAAALGVAGDDHLIVTTTLSKSLAAQGGAVLGSTAVRDHLINTARPFIYDTGLAPAAAGAALAALRILTRRPELADSVRANAALLAQACGLEPVAGAVLSVAMPGPQEALDGVARAAAAGVRIGCFRPPSTPDGDSRLRFTAHAQHTREQLAPALAVLADVTR
ncbi:MAG: 8-amino-7-oxononanoate synthase [Mobilicoccus sp.]|nr:8-amino-7-oxononanoate synthase [Mobilicoccus sp.]